MSDSRPRSTDEKGTAVESKSKLGFFRRATSQKPSKHEDQLSPQVPEAGIEGVTEVPPVGFFQLFRFATKFETTINILSLIAAAAAGAAQPLMTLLFANLTQDFVSFTAVLRDPSRKDQIPAAAAAFRSSAARDASYLVYIGIGVFFCTYAYMFVWVYTGEINAKRVRERYLRAVLGQDIQYFDKVGAGEVATRIQTDTHLVQQGTSEKVALAVNYLASFICGFVLAYVRSWRLALALSSVLPFFGITGAIMTKFMTKFMQSSLKHTAESGSLAEEVISTVRTAQAFGTQAVLSNLYNIFIDKALKADVRAEVWQGSAFGAFVFVIYASYALAFSFGTTLINANNADAGAIVNVIMSILIGCLAIVQLEPELQAITRGRGAAAQLYAIMDRVPDINSANPDGLKPGVVDGEISLEDVKFTYPSRPNVPVVKGLSLTFKAGKTVALVGASGSGKSTIISLVERFYDPTSGVVKLDGVDLKELNLKW
ncbi:hypothetical protein P691DRAFT_587071, partial [Macrolepiota fuliginosa MF-IS2]